jgi:adenylate cyclase
VGNAEAERTLGKLPATWEACDYYMRAASTLTSFLSSFDAPRLFEAYRLAERSIQLDPQYSRPYCILSSALVIAWMNSFDTSAYQPATLDRAQEMAAKAVRLDANLAEAHGRLGNVLSWKRQHDTALAAFERAQALNPNFMDWRLITALIHASQPTRALEVGRSYMRLDPFAPATAVVWLGVANYLLGDYEKASRHLGQAASRMPNARFAHNWLAATYAQMGELELARSEVQEVLRIDPTYSIEGRARIIFGFRSPIDTEHFFDGLRKAGIPER